MILLFLDVMLWIYLEIMISAIGIDLVVIYVYLKSSMIVWWIIVIYDGTAIAFMNVVNYP